MNVEWALTEKSVFVQLRDIGRRGSGGAGSKKESASRDGLSHNNNFTNNLIFYHYLQPPTRSRDRNGWKPT